MYPAADPNYSPVEFIRELAAGLQEGDSARHLITVLNDPGRGITSSYLHNEPWLACNMHQTWNSVHLIYPLIVKDYALTPPKPIVNPEAAHENGPEYEGLVVNDLIIRRQGYYCYVAGASYSYGETYNWRSDQNLWEQNWNAPGAKNMTVLKKLFTSVNWWNLVPDQLMLTEGSLTDGAVLNLACRDSSGGWAMAYLADGGSVSVAMNKLSGPVKAWWFDPRTGEPSEIGKFDNTGTHRFDAPSGGPDWVLVLHDTTRGFPLPGEEYTANGPGPQTLASPEKVRIAPMSGKDKPHTRAPALGIDGRVLCRGRTGELRGNGVVIICRENPFSGGPAVKRSIRLR
jgi:hypothetical protein